MLILSIIKSVRMIDNNTLKIYFIDNSTITATNTDDDGVIINKQIINSVSWSNIVSSNDILTYWDMLVRMSHIIKKEVCKLVFLQTETR